MRKEKASIRLSLLPDYGCHMTSCLSPSPTGGTVSLELQAKANPSFNFIGQAFRPSKKSSYRGW